MKDSETNQQVAPESYGSENYNSENYGIEVKEVDFTEFDRRKAPRISSYQSFVDSLEPTPIAIEFVI